MNEFCSSQESFSGSPSASTFLVSVADRFGVLGPYGAKNVSSGDWNHFVQYVATLNWFVPKALIPALSVLETTIETALGVALLVGLWQRIVAWWSAGLLVSFALTMSVALGIGRASQILGVHGIRCRFTSGCGCC